jgi:hypothetical protein
MSLAANFFNIFGNNGDWDSDSIGHVATVYAKTPEEALRTYFSRFPEAVGGKKYEDFRLMVDPGAIMDIIEDDELNSYYSGQDDAAMYDGTMLIIASQVRESIKDGEVG